MAKPWQTIDSIDTEEGLLALKKRAERDFLITIAGRVLMNSMAQRSEVALGRCVGEHLSAKARSRVIVGGLGMGITLQALLDTANATARVVVAELNPVVVKWCRGPLSALTGGAVLDPRVDVKIDNVANLIQRYTHQTNEKKFDAIALDLYTGPYRHAHGRDDPLYGDHAIRNARKALQPGGLFAVWGEDYDPTFVKRLSEAGFVASTKRSGKGGVRHVLYLGKLEKGAAR